VVVGKLVYTVLLVSQLEAVREVVVAGVETVAVEVEQMFHLYFKTSHKTTTAF